MAQSHHKYNYTAHVMGCDFDVSIVTMRESVANALYARALMIAQSYEQTFSRFLPQSELSILNLTKQIAPSERFLRIIARARDLYHETDHLCNPLVQIARYGYTASFESIKGSQRTCDTTPPNCDFDTVDITPSHITLHEDQRLDFAAFLKGAVAQRIAHELFAHDAVSGIIVNIGGDLSTYGTDAHSTPFTIFIENPITHEDYAVTLTNTTLATSGTTRRHWTCNSTNVHHILAPTQHENPATELVSASVILPDGARSDAFATVAIILGTAGAQRFLRKHDAAFLLITADGTLSKSMP